MTPTISILLAAAVQAAPEMPAWLAGCWEQQDGARWTEECWSSPKGGLMLGSARTLDGGKLRNWEVMQIMIADDGGAMHFWAAPNGVNRSRLEWRPDESPGVTFHDPGHDYPQRVRYWRDGELLQAEISAADGSNPMRWTYRRVQASR